MQNLAEQQAVTTEVQIWEGDHERALELFSRCPIVMQVGVSGAVFTGIDPIALDVIARVMRVDLTAGLLDDVTVMGSAAALEMNQQRAAQ